MVVSRYGQWWIGHLALYRPQLCIILLVHCGLHWYGLAHIRLHTASYTFCFQFQVLLFKVRAGSYSWWLQLQRRGQLTGVWITAVSHRVARCFKRLLFGSIRLRSHLVEVFLEPCLAVMEWWGRWSRKEVGSPEDYIVSYKSKWNKLQPTCTIDSSWFWLRIAALRIAAGDPNGPAIGSKSIRWCLFVCRDILWWATVDISFLIDIKRTFFDRKDVWWCLSRDIAGMLHDSHANHQVQM